MSDEEMKANNLGKMKANGMCRCNIKNPDAHVQSLNACIKCIASWES
jgi:cell division ATPase FtsA